MAARFNGTMLVGAVTIGLLSFHVFSTSARAQQPPAPKPVAPKPVAAKLNFDDVGPQVGEQLPALRLRNAKGDVQRLDDAWRGGPALLVTSSLTCPKSRSRWPELKALTDKYGEKLNVVIVYVIEAHPVGSVCPYKGVEDITPENERDGILRKQPTTLDERIELAQEFKRYLGVGTPIYIDNPQNQAWKALGAAPNLALLVDRAGLVVAREGWFEGAKMKVAIDKFLALPKIDKELPEVPEREREALYTALAKAGMEDRGERALLEDKDTTSLARVLTQVPAFANFVIGAEQGHRSETTALMEAIDRGNLAAAKLLLKHGADVQARTSSYDSALQLAAINGNLEAVQLLLEHKADPAFPRTGDSPVHVAALHGHRQVVEALLAAGAPSDFFVEIALGHRAAVQKALAADPSWALRADGASWMPLDYAAANGELAIATLLLAHGASVVEDARVSLEPPLHRAISRKDVAMVKLLLQHGSSPSTAVGHGGESSMWEPALHRVIAEGNLEMLKLLLAYKPHLEARNTYSQTALHEAAASDSAEMVAALIQAGADVNALQLGFSLPCGSGEEETPSNNTPLHYAAARGNPAIIKLLVQAGAKLAARNVYGHTPLMAMVQPPLYTGLDEDARVANATALLAAGANVNARDENGKTLLDLAQAQQASGDPFRTKHLPELIALLKKHGAQSGGSKPKK